MDRVDISGDHAEERPRDHPSRDGLAGTVPAVNQRPGTPGPPPPKRRHLDGSIGTDSLPRAPTVVPIPEDPNDPDVIEAEIAWDPPSITACPGGSRFICLECRNNRINPAMRPPSPDVLPGTIVLRHAEVIRAEVILTHAKSTTLRNSMRIPRGLRTLPTWILSPRR